MTNNVPVLASNKGNKGNVKPTAVGLTTNKDNMLADLLAQLAQAKADQAALQARLANGSKKGPQAGTCFGYRPAAILRLLGRQKVGKTAAAWVIAQSGHTVSTSTVSTQYGLGAASTTAKNRADDDQLPVLSADNQAKLDKLLADPACPKGNGNGAALAAANDVIAKLQATLDRLQGKAS